MPHVPAPAPFTDADYELIAAAVLETARGRWFLAEHARRNRQADTRLVLEAIEKLERTIAHRPEMPESDRVRVDLVEMMNAITRTKHEIAALRPPEATRSHFDHASHELDAIVDATEKATSDILAAAERVQEIAWTLREQGVDATVCDLIDAHATEVYTACSFQDITGQRTRKVIEVMRFLEARINAMIRIWRLDDMESSGNGNVPPAPEVRGSQDSPDRLQQQGVDKLIGNERKPDVIWRDVPTAEISEARNLGEFDLDDLVVYEANPAAQSSVIRKEVQFDDDLVVRDVPPPAPPAAPPAPPARRIPAAPPVQPSGKEEPKIESLTFAERMALFG
jgi:chemotaxis regulatin CheY-phosphate phosphatase CheZ